MSSSLASEYNQLAAQYFRKKQPYFRDVQAEMRRELGLRVRGRVVLDAGCATGEFTAFAARKARRAEGVDFSQGMVREARRRYGRLSNVHFRVGDVTKLPFRPKSFDGVFSFAVLSHVRDLPRAFGEFARVLKPGGFLIVDVTNPRSLGGLLGKRYLGRENYFLAPVEEVLSQLAAAGFHVERRRYFQLVPLFTKLVFPIDFWRRVFSLRIGGQLLDEQLSSLPVLRAFALEQLIIARKV